MEHFDHIDIEKKWQEKWEEEGVYKTLSQARGGSQNCFVLDMFPYPSGAGLHVGHPRGYIATDVYSRMKRMSGFNVLHPMGWDAFGLPAENHAIKNKVHPRHQVEENIARFKSQLQMMGVDYDWSREINTTDPAFYKWTQWCFLEMFKKGLAYESHEPINWCPSCKTGLANEDLDSDGTCERCSSVVEKKPLRQWVLRITDYADRLLDDLGQLPRWPEWVKEAQRNWIGRSEGALISFKLQVASYKGEVSVFTTRPDTLFGATYLVLAPEHEQVADLLDRVENREEVEAYIKSTGEKTELDRQQSKEKTGVELRGVTATNPANGESIPVWIADYVLAGYGTGAVMAVPAHDERDFEFATRFGLPIRQVVVPGDNSLNGQKQPYVIKFVEPENWELLRSGVKTIETRTPLPSDPNKRYDKLKTGDLLRAVNVSSQEDLILEITSKKVYKSLEELFEEPKVLASVLPVNTPQTIEELYERYKFTNDYHERIAQNGLVLWGVKLVSGAGCYSGNGVLSNSGDFTGLSSSEAKQKITEHVGGEMAKTYRLNDWVFSRQRYWGEPIPLVHVGDRAYAVDESQLPVILPDVESYAPTGTGESPLADIDEWVNVVGYLTEQDTFVVTDDIPKGKERLEGRRETNTMPQWAGSSWYYLRYLDPTNNDAFCAPEIEKEWMPADVYVGGDHATRHLIYARFWHKFLFDIGVVSHAEPFPRLEFLGYILAEDGSKISKRKQNGEDPADIVDRFGADSLRTYEMFIGPFEKTVPWSTDGVVGVRRFLERVWKLAHEPVRATQEDVPEITTLLHKAIKKVGEDIEAFHFNTAVAMMMTFTNEALKVEGGITQDSLKTFLRLLAPFAPHITEEIWRTILGHDTSIHTETWPTYDPELVVDDVVVLGVQINGKVRAEIQVAIDEAEESVRERVVALPELAKWLEGKDVVKFIYVPGRIVNMVLA